MGTRASAQVILRTSDNIPANYVTNTFYFDLLEDLVGEGPLGPSQRIAAQTALIAMYQTIRTRLGGLATTGHRIKWVDIDGPAPQYPYHEEVWDFDGPVPTTVLPAEVCIVSSFEAEQISGINQASRRGRVFLGPLAASSLDQLTGRVTSGTQTAIATAFQTLAAAQDETGLTGWRWMVYSRVLDAQSKVVMGHVDNAFDTQRRRGVESTVRSVWED